MCKLRATSTILCPANPAATQTLTCGLEGFGYSVYLISQQPGLTAAQCEQSCLSDPNCRSFQTQTGGDQYCNKYNQPTAGNILEVDADYTFYDRDCITDFTPVSSCIPGGFQSSLILTAMVLGRLHFSPSQSKARHRHSYVPRNCPCKPHQLCM